MSQISLLGENGIYGAFGLSTDPVKVGVVAAVPEPAETSLFGLGLLASNGNDSVINFLLGAALITGGGFHSGALSRGRNRTPPAAVNSFPAGPASRRAGTSSSEAAAAAPALTAG